MAARRRVVDRELVGQGVRSRGDEGRRVGDADRLRMPIRLDLVPARVTLVNAPPGAYVSCPALAFAAPGGTLQNVQLPEARWSGTCEFSVPGSRARKKSVTLDAGEVNAIEW